MFILFKLLFRVKAEGRENIPARGPAIFASNHTSYIDPIVIGISVKPRVTFLAKSELYSIPILRSVLKMLGALPVRAGIADRESLRKTIEALQNGGVVGLFPEGTRSRDGNLLPPHKGVAMIALKTSSPIVPTAITGTYKVLPADAHFIRIAPIKIRFGPPIYPRDFADKEDSRELISKRIMEEIRRLLEIDKGTGGDKSGDLN